MNIDFKNYDIIQYVEELHKECIPENEISGYVKAFLESKARETAVPMHGSFELTPLCNLDCKMCYVHLSSNKFNSNNLLSSNDWKNLMLQAHNAGMIRASLTGGECLTYPYFDDIYLFLKSIGVEITVLTNGILIDKNRVDFFKAHRPGMIYLSLYGSSDDAYYKVTGNYVFDTLYQNIMIIKRERLPLTISITPNHYMVDDMRKIIELTESLEIPYNINSSLIPPRKNTGRTLQDFTASEYAEIYKIKSELNGKILKPVDISELPEESHRGKSRNGLLCGAGRSSFGIRYDGMLCPCLSLDHINANALEIGFDKAWKIVNSKAKSYPVPLECGECSYSNLCQTCAAMHKNANNPGHCDRRICERTKTLVSEGLLPIPKIHEETGSL